MLKHTRLFFLGFLAVAGAFLLIPQAYAQALSAQGVAVGSNKVGAVVPLAGETYTIIDTLVALREGVEFCANEGRFFVSINPDGTFECRGGVPPVVEFCQDGTNPDGENFCGGGTHVRVQAPFDIADPVSDEDPIVFAGPYGDLDGENGTVTRLP